MSRSLKKLTRSVVTDILSKKHEAPMSGDEIATFKTAFILLLMTKFLALQTLLDNICPKYFMALKNLDDIPNWN